MVKITWFSVFILVTAVVAFGSVRYVYAHVADPMVGHIFAFGILALAGMYLMVAYASLQQNRNRPISLHDQECPDFWTKDESTGKCLNPRKMGTCNTPSGGMDFSGGAFQSASSENAQCAKYTWAKRCGISWDGVTYGVANPCRSTL